MNLHYRLLIVLPKRPSLPILARDGETGVNKVITLQEAKNIVFGAVLRGDTVHGEIMSDALIDTIIYIVDKNALNAARQAFDGKLRDAGLLPLELEVGES